MLIDLNVAELENMNSSMVKQIAQHNRIYEHLFHRDAVFDPIVRLDVKYPNDAGVYFGNPLAPDEVYSSCFYQLIYISVYNSTGCIIRITRRRLLDTADDKS